MTLDSDHVAQILDVALDAGYWELDAEGQFPADPVDLLVAAVDLVRQCRLHAGADSQMSGVTQILSIADGESVETFTEGASMASEEEQLAGQTDEQLLKLHQTLSNYPPSEEVDKSMALVYGEMQKRGLAGGATPAPAAAEPAPEPVAEAAPPAVSPDRAALEDQLTLGIMRKHGIDPSEISTLSDETLAWVVSHPGGGEAAPAPTPQAAPAQPEPSPADGEVIETTRMVIPEPKTESAPAPVAEPSAPASSISPERLALEEQVTGPMNKAYRRGRLDIPNLGDNELRLMIEHPDGKVTPAELEAAKALDRGEAPAPEPDPEPVSEPVQDPPADSGFGPAQTEPAPPVQEAPVTVEPEAAAVPVTPAVPARVTTRTALATETPVNPAQEIIDREGFPIPQELDGDPPRIPHDISQSTDDELRSLHARAHAVQTRANYIVGLWEGELRDIVKLRKGREVEVANGLPSKDGTTKITDAQREARVQADPEVIQFSEQEHGIERVLRQLKTLQENYNRDVSTCSRQWSMRHKELEGAGGLRS